MMPDSSNYPWARSIAPRSGPNPPSRISRRQRTPPQDCRRWWMRPAPPNELDLANRYSASPPRHWWTYKSRRERPRRQFCCRRKTGKRSPVIVDIGGGPGLGRNLPQHHQRNTNRRQSQREASGFQGASGGESESLIRQPETKKMHICHLDGSDFEFQSSRRYICVTIHGGHKSLCVFPESRCHAPASWTAASEASLVTSSPYWDQSAATSEGGQKNPEAEIKSQQGMR